jgi:hypothetical protein
MSDSCHIEFSDHLGHSGDPASWDPIGLACKISGDTASESAFEWFRTRLGRCVQEHGLCKMHGGGPLPARVLDVGQDVSAANANVRPRESNGACDRYVCLSYCWGGTIDIRLTKD